MFTVQSLDTFEAVLVMATLDRDADDPEAQVNS